MGKLENLIFLHFQHLFVQFHPSNLVISHLRHDGGKKIFPKRNLQFCCHMVGIFNLLSLVFPGLAGFCVSTQIFLCDSSGTPAG